jgi:hypothetical protein
LDFSENASTVHNHSFYALDRGARWRMIQSWSVFEFLKLLSGLKKNEIKLQHIIMNLKSLTTFSKHFDTNCVVPGDVGGARRTKARFNCARRNSENMPLS